MKRIIHIRDAYLLLFLSILMLAGCSQEDLLPEADRIVRFTASIEGVSTRMSDTSWESQDKIGISCSRFGYTNVAYKYSSGFSAVSNGILYQSPEQVDFTAYYPYNSSGGTISVAASTVSAQTASTRKSIDYLYGTGSGKLGSGVNLTFSHKMSQVTLEFKAGTGVSDLSKLTSYTLSDMVLGGTFDTSTGVAASSGTSKGSITQSVSGSGTTYEAPYLLLFPQSVSSLSLKVTVDGKEYSGTLSVPSSTLSSGGSVKFTVTINKQYISVGSYSIGAWSTSSSSSGCSDYNIQLVTADDAEQYALAFKNGLFLNIWDSSTSAINTEVWNKFTADSDLKSNVCGIVYWLGTANADDDILKLHHPDCTHGLIVALSDANSGSYCAWQSSYEFIYEEFQGESEYGVSTSQGYSTIELTWNNNDTKKLNKILGYNNTYVLRRYNATRVKESNMSDYEVKAVTAIDNYTPSAPKGSSGWFLPSPKELVLLVNGTSSISFGNNNNYTDNSVKTNIGTILTALNSAGVSVSKTSLNNYYWSSSESASNSLNAYLVGFGSGDYGYVSNLSKFSANFYVRAVSAF